MTNCPPDLYCSFFIESWRFTREEWKFYFDCVSAILLIIAGPFGLYKVIVELKRIREQSEKDTVDKHRGAALKRTEFFLSQHRRLFDDKELREVLLHLDEGMIELADPAIWENKRKFMTFIEEMALLVESDHITPDVAYYMFGHYAICAAEGENFRIGMMMEVEHWKLFYKFVTDAKKYKDKGSPDLGALKL